MYNSALYKTEYNNFVYCLKIGRILKSFVLQYFNDFRYMESAGFKKDIVQFQNFPLTSLVAVLIRNLATYFLRTDNGCSMHVQ
jgi:hypothetical protein